MRVVIYTPEQDDPNSGDILMFVQGSLINIEAHNLPFIEVTEKRDDWDSNFKVVNGKVVPK